MRQQIAVLSIAEGFFQSNVLFGLLELDIFARLGRGEKAVTALAQEIGCGEPRLRRLLNAGVSLGLLVRTAEDGYSIAEGFHEILLPDAGESYLGNWVKNLAYFQDAFSKLGDSVRTGKPPIDPDRHLGEETEATEDFILAMHNYATLRGKELAHFLDTTGCRSMLDIGCGPGTYAYHLGAKNPDLDLTLADLPDVLEIAKDVRQRFDLTNTIRYLPMDAVKDEIEGTYDLIFVSNMLHLIGKDASRALVKRIYQAINPGGSLVIQGQFLNNDRLGGRWPVFVDLVQMVISDAGENHSFEETAAWLEEGGFTDIEINYMSIYNTNSFVRGYKKI